ncbi:hypothetical protein ACLB2K_058131 [Fragaria x ananassa]
MCRLGLTRPIRKPDPGPNNLTKLHLQRSLTHTLRRNLQKFSRTSESISKRSPWMIINLEQGESSTCGNENEHPELIEGHTSDLEYVDEYVESVSSRNLEIRNSHDLNDETFMLCGMKQVQGNTDANLFQTNSLDFFVNFYSIQAMSHLFSVEARFTSYPGTYTEEDGRLFPDPDYSSHIDYRWGCEGLKKSIWKLLNAPDGERNSGSSNQIEEDLKSSNSHCISYLNKDPSKARKVDDLRQKLRMRGLRCHPMYLFVRWRLNVANMFMFLGERGDTDYEEMIAGTHKTIIMKGVVGKGPEELLRTSGSYVRDDIVPPKSPLVAIVNGQAPTADEIVTALKQVSKSAAGM